MEPENNENVISVSPIETSELKGLGELFYEKMQEHKDTIALTDALAGYKQTYKEIFDETVRIATAMHRKGLKPKDIVSICSYNAIDCPLYYYACFFIGAIPANLDPSLPYEDFVKLLKGISPKMMFVAPEAVRIIKRALRETKLDIKVVALVDEPYLLSAREFYIPTLQEKDFVPYHVEDLDDVAQIVFSSGTSGLPKPICLSHRSLLGHLHQMGSNLTRGMGILHFSNLSYIDWAVYTVIQIVYGLNQVVYPLYEKEAIVWHFIEEYKISIISLNPQQIMGVCQNERLANADLSSLSIIVITGDLVTAKQMQYFKSCFPKSVTLINAYGQAEQCGAALSFIHDLILKNEQFLIGKPSSVGKPMPGYSCKVVDFKTNEILGPNQKGELLIKSKYQMCGYHNIDSSHIWDSDGFMLTGDIAYFDEDCCFYIIGRISDILRNQSEPHIFPIEIEEIFYRHPAVDACIITSLSHPVNGEILVGVVALKKSTTGGTLTEEGLRKFVDDQVDEVPRLEGGVRFLKEIPLTITNKLDRKKVKELIQQEQI